MTESGFKDRVGKKDMDCLDISKKLNDQRPTEMVDS